MEPNLMNVSYAVEPPTTESIWTTDLKTKIEERLKSVIQIWTGGWQFKFIKYGWSEYCNCENCNFFNCKRVQNLDSQN